MFEAIVAEDETLLRKALLEQLGKAWPELRIVAECEDGASALEAIAEHRPDVAFLDIRSRLIFYWTANAVNHGVCYV